ncbi:hypothetical protein HPB51_010220 [Rhipicephalus microplus]|uniref:Uncharacterized protein n=1 Tax=Rhipicephalus microplus TaxID=6941 RepID=A0A9J6F2V5_RHIMP|nr:hypothetical protein HPB51_010220 [Rhipicephalus microplus]
MLENVRAREETPMSSATALICYHCYKCHFHARLDALICPRSRCRGRARGASLEALNSFLRQYYLVTENTETEVLLSVMWLIHFISTGSITLTSSGTDRLVGFLKTVAKIQVSPGASEEVLLGLAKVMQNLAKHPTLLNASAQLFSKVSTDSGSCPPLDSVLQELRDNLSPLLEAADINIVSSKTYVGVLVMEVGKALAKLEYEEENVRHSTVAKMLRDSFVGIKLDRLLYIQDTGLESLKKVAVCLEALQMAVLRLLQPSAISKLQNEAKATAAEKATMRVQLNVSSERMVLALLKDALERRLDDELLCEVFHILVLLLRCQECLSLIATASDSKYMSDCVLKLCTSRHSSVREAMVSDLPSVLCHIQLDDALIASLLDLLEDSDYVVRMKFGYLLLLY